MTDLGTRTEPALRRAAPALLGYAAVRALGLLTLALWSAARDKSAYTLLTARWDALWYTRVAEGGYGYEVRLPNGDVHSNLAFFPLLPWLERLLSAVTPLSYADAGFAVSLLASLAAAWGIFAVTDHVYGHRAGVCAVLLWAVLPVGIVQSMAYSESLFTALAAWSLYALLTERWVTAGLLASLAGLTRPVGLAVVAAVWATGAVAFLRERRAREETDGGTGRRDHGASGSARAVGEPDAPGNDMTAHEPHTPGDQPTAPGPGSPAADSFVRNRSTAETAGARATGHAPGAGTASKTERAAEAKGALDPARAPDADPSHLPDSSPAHSTDTGHPGTPPPALHRLLGMALAPLGTAAYVLWVGHRTGKGPLGYLDVQAGWRNGFDGGYAFARFVGDKFMSFPSALAGAGLIVGVGLIIWLYVICVRQGQPLPLLVYAGVVTALALCASSYFGSKPRLLMPAFPLLLPLALTLARARTRRSVAVVAAIATASALYGAFWLNGSGPP
ncbi:mannosyltransferase family protein [Streptomyces sp. NPDC057253]|uniref:mannosyltransferase family protein n=1 Tax=Streptomyces sp. NPDC057253 TaxID=3346069 RepID=UPI0036314DB5